MNRLFIYGTLLSDEVLRIILGRRCKKHVAYLHGYQRFKVANEVYPAIRPALGGVVEGALLKDLGKSDLALLDRYEGDFYQRLEVSVNLPEQGTSTCMAYVIRPEYIDLLSESSWSYAAFTEQHLDDFVAMLRAGEE